MFVQFTWNHKYFGSFSVTELKSQFSINVKIQSLLTAFHLLLSQSEWPHFPRWRPFRRHNWLRVLQAPTVRVHQRLLCRTSVPAGKTENMWDMDAGRKSASEMTWARLCLGMGRERRFWGVCVALCVIALQWDLPLVLRLYSFTASSAWLPTHTHTLRLPETLQHHSNTP